MPDTKKKTQWLPGRREARLAMTKNWLEVLALKAVPWGVPAVDVTALTALTTEAGNSLAVVLSADCTKVAIAQCKTDFKALIVKMRYIKRRNFTKPPLDDADFAALGLPVPDPTNTAGGEIIDTIDMSFKNDPRPDSHTQYVYFKILGADNRSKYPYHMAVFQRYIQGPGDPEPIADKDALWTRDIIVMSSPYVSTFDSADAGKICWYRSRWEAFSGKQGKWSMIRAMIP
jgi:hypothetical protein